MLVDVHVAVHVDVHEGLVWKVQLSLSGQEVLLILLLKVLMMLLCWP